MSGKGKGKGSYIRHRRNHILKDSIKGITNPSIRRLSRKAGITTVGNSVYSSIRNTTKEYVTEIMKDAIIYKNYRKAKTVTVEDIYYALNRNGQTIYGFDNIKKKKKRNKKKSKEFTNINLSEKK